MRFPVSSRAGALVLVVGLFAACGDEGADDASDAGIGDIGTDATQGDAASDADAGVDSSDAAPDVAPDATSDVADSGDAEADAPEDADVASDAQADSDAGDPLPPDCDPLDPGFCALPWPSSLYLAPDATTVTGYRLQFGADTFPADRGGISMRPELFGHLDGYGLGTPIMALFDALDVTELPGEESIERSMAPESHTVLLRVLTDGSVERVPHWVELDATVPDTDPRVLFLRPAVILEPDTRYVVALRDLRDTSGASIAASAAFAALRDGTDSSEVDAARREHFEGVFALLAEGGVARDATLTLAWDFHTASYDSLHGNLDTSIDLVFAELDGQGAPFVEREELYLSTRDGADGTEQDDEIAWRVQLVMRSPSVVVSRGVSQGWELNRNEDGAIALAEPQDVRVRVLVPHSVAEGEPGGVLVYGHGLLGDEEEIELGYLQRIAEAERLILVACPLMGMSAYEASSVLLTTLDMNNFIAVADGLVQGIVQTHVLARSAVTTLPAVLQEIDSDIGIDTERLFWWGGSQGGIFGATILATSPDIDRGGLAVPGINYSTMLQRSVNFERYFEQLRNSYGRGAPVAVLIAAAQLLWDSTDPVSFWGRLVGRAPFEDRPRQALLLVAKADKQVAVVTNEVLARTFPEVAVMAGYDERIPWGISETAYPHDGTGMVLFDFGNPWPVGRSNQPPLDEFRDPHSRLIEVEAVGALVHSFLTDGSIIDVCGGDGCNPD